MQRDVPTPRSGEVLIRVAASGLNRADLSQIAGRYPPPSGESEVLGLEVSGWIADSKQPVCALLAGGGHAEYVAAPAGQVFPAPQAIELVAAGGIPEAYLTAYVNLVVEAGLGSGDRVLVHAGASGVGLAAIQVAKLLGAQVAATTRTREKLTAMEEAGADIVFDTTQTDVETELERRWGANCVAVVLNSIGGASLATDLRLLATGGRIVCIASMAGPKIELEIPLLMRKRARLIGSTLRARPREEKARLVAGFKEQILPALDAGRLRVHVHSIVPPEQAAAAFQALRDNQTTGKVLIQWERT